MLGTFFLTDKIILEYIFTYNKERHQNKNIYFLRGLSTPVRKNVKVDFENKKPGVLQKVDFSYVFHNNKNRHYRLNNRLNK